jgi:translocation and assembly module TamA
LTPDKRHVFAAKLMWGTIIGASRHDIPPPDRLFAGSENTLRGYRYMTVSPLGCDDKPLGGRSLFIYSLELRNRIGKNFGLVWFYDIGNVYKDFYPEFKKGMLQSVGLGLRYYTPIGPLRLDIAFPLNKRHIDNRLEAYFSIGQSF